MAAARFRKTTGWIEEGRNLFHPGDIMGVIASNITDAKIVEMIKGRRDTVLSTSLSPYSPLGILGMIELTCHFLGEGRECCQQNIIDRGDGSGIIGGYIFNVIPRFRVAQALLRESFPDLAGFVDARARDMALLFDCGINDSQMGELLIPGIEAVFGGTIRVLPTTRITQQEIDARVRRAQGDLQRTLQENGIDSLIAPDRASAAMLAALAGMRGRGVAHGRNQASHNAPHQAGKRKK